MVATSTGIGGPGVRPAADDGPGRRADIQGLRGVAVSLVVLYHLDEALPSGYLGVDVFFVVSGYVITLLLARTLRRDGRVSLRSFFARRARRLLPLLAVTLVATTLLSAVLLSPTGPSRQTAKTAAAAALLNANTFLARQADDYFGQPPEANALLHTWSLSAEEQFYLALPVLVAVALALRRRSPRLRSIPPAALAAAGALASLALCVVALSGRIDALVQAVGFPSGQAIAFYSAPTRAWQLLAGGALALAGGQVRRLPRALLAVLGVVGLLAVLVASAVDLGGGRSVVPMAVPTVAAVLILMGGTVGGTPAAAVLGQRWLVWIGDRSYGWYLFYWPLIVFVAANTASIALRWVAAAVALGLAAIAHRTIEERYRRDARLEGARALRLAAACIGAPVLVAAIVLAAQPALSIPDLAEARLRHIDSAECNRRDAAPRPIDDPTCTWEVDDAVGRIVLFGDSHASMWSEAVIAAGNELGYDVSITTMSGCPPLGAGAMRYRSGVLDETCRDHVEATLDELVELQPSLVLLGTGSLGILSPDDEGWVDPDGAAAPTVDDRLDILEAGLGATVGRLAEGGVPAAVLHDVPYHSFTTAECGWLRYRVAPDGCASSRDRRSVDAELAGPRRAEVRAVASVPSSAAAPATIIDPLPWICDASTCSTYAGGTWMYRDGDHLSVAGATRLAGPVREALVELGL